MKIDNKRLIKELKNIYKSIGIIIELFEENNNKSQKGKLIQKPPAASREELKEEWKALQNRYDGSLDAEKMIDEFVASKSKNYLIAFIKANDLPIQAKESKTKIANSIKGLLKVGSTITGNKNT